MAIARDCKSLLFGVRRFESYLSHKWSIRQVVKPSPFHGEVTGSNPVWITNGLVVYLVRIEDFQSSEAGSIPVETTKMHQSTSGLGRHPFKVVGRKSPRGFESRLVYKMGCYTVGVAGLTVNQVSSDSGGSTPSHPTMMFIVLAVVAFFTLIGPSLFGSDRVK